MSSNVEGQASNVEGAGDVPHDLHHGGIIEALLVRFDSYPADCAETMRALGKAYLVVEGSIDRDRLAARRRIIRRFGDIVPYVSSDDDDERAAAQRLLVSLWPAGTNAAAALCAPHVDVLVRSLKFEKFPDHRRPEPGWTLSAWVDFVIGAVGVRGLVNDYRFPDLDGDRNRAVWTSEVLAHLGPAAFEEHAGMLISILGDADMDINAHWNNHDEISRLLQMLDPKVLASHTGHLIAGMLTAQPWAASEFFPEVFAKFSPDAQETDLLPAIVRLSHHDDSEYRYYALLLIEVVDPPLRERTCATMVVDLLRDQNADVRLYAMSTLEKKFELHTIAAHAPVIAEFLTGLDTGMRLHAFQTLRKLEQHDIEKYVPVIVRCVDDPDLSVGLEALHTLCQLGPRVIETCLSVIVPQLHPGGRLWHDALNCMEKLEPHVLEPHAALIAACCQDKQYIMKVDSAFALFEKLPASLQMEHVHAVEAMKQIQFETHDHVQAKKVAAKFAGICERADRLIEALYAPGGPGFLQAQADFQSHA